jgi:hypothetical protein
MYASTTEPNSSESANSHGKSMRVHSEKPGVGVASALDGDISIQPLLICVCGKALSLHGGKRIRSPLL